MTPEGSLFEVEHRPKVVDIAHVGRGGPAVGRVDGQPLENRRTHQLGLAFPQISLNIYEIFSNIG